MTSATIRRLGALFLLLLAGSMFAPEAHAQTEAQAIAACLAKIDNTGDNHGDICRGPYGVDDTTPETGWYQFSQSCSGVTPAESGLYPTTRSVGSCGSGSSNHQFTSRCPGGVDYLAGGCRDTRCEVARDFGIVTSGNLEQLMCLHNEDDGGTCEVAGLVGPDGFVHLYATGDTCNKDTYTCPSGYYKDLNGACTKKTECPEGVPLDLETNTCAQPEVCPEGTEKGPQGVCRTSDNSNCPAGHVKGPDGLCVADPNMCPAGTVGTSGGGCATDADGDGEPDENNEFIDSASCDSPPICNGDDILCGQAKQLWRIDCNTRRHANVQLDEYCKMPPVCERIVTFDQNRGSGCTEQEEAMMFLQWKTMCAVQSMAEKDVEGGENDGDANDNGQPDWTENPGDGTEAVNLGDDDSDGSLRALVVSEGPVIGSGGVDGSGLGFTRTCPVIPPITMPITGQVIEIDTTIFCEWMHLGGWFVKLLALLASLTMLATGVRK